MATGRTQRQQAQAEEKIATRSSDILNGTIHVPDLSLSTDSIGEMAHVCAHCGAYKFKKETPSSCCLEGKVRLTPFPPPPSKICGLTTLLRPK